jgi:hypothetical protein
VTPATLGLHQPTGRSLLHERIRGRAEGICLGDAGLRGKALYKVVSVEQGVRRWQAHVKTTAMGEPVAGQPDT